MTSKLFIFPILLLPLILYSSLSNAQFQNGVPLASPVPPDAAALFKVVEKPLGTYTGTVPVSFPLFSLNSGSLSADVALNYTGTGGIKVEEYASSVGLGFSLADGGGRIVQVIHGHPDDNIGLITNPYSTNPNNFNCSNTTQLYQYAHDQFDLEPDEFYYSFNGKSGKFFFKQDSSIVIDGNTGITIEKAFFTPPGPSGIKKWVITDEYGNKYYFGYNKNETVSYRIVNQSSWSGTSGSGPSGRVTSVSWFLTEVTDANEENRIKFSYVVSGDSYTAFSGAFWPINTTWYSCTFFNTTPDFGTAVTTTAGEYLISRIDTRTGYAIFNSTADRTDALSRKINAIQIYDSAGVYKKQFKFNYGYMGQSPRLKLVSFSEFGASGTDSVSTAFEYEELQQLPSRNSASVDLWGYYNGVYNPHLLPNIIYKNSLFSFRNTSFANRNANGAYAQANILKKIIYPTGGYRQFIYEGNTALMSLDLNSYHPDPDYTNNVSITRSDFNTTPAPLSCLTHNFTVNSVDGWTDFTYSLSGIGGSCTGYGVRLYKTTNPGDATGGIPIFDNNDIPSGERELVNGYYRLEVYKPSYPCTLGSITFGWYEATFNTATIITPQGAQFTRNNRKVGGVRVKEIRDYDPVSGQTSTTEYRYKLYSVDSNFTSGQLVSPINIVGQANSDECGCGIPILVPGSAYPLAAHDGSYVVYPEVRTVESGKGWTDQKFSYVSDYPSYGYPSVPSQDNSVQRGQLLEKRIYNQSGVLLEKINNGFAYTPSDAQMGIIGKAYYARFSNPYTVWSDIPETPDQLPAFGSCKSYYLTGQGRMLAYTIDSTFTAQGNFATRTDYQYTPRGRYYTVKNLKAILNDGDIMQTTSRYSFTPNAEFTFSLSGTDQTMKSNLAAMNILQPIETVDSLKPASGAGKLVGGTKYSFALFNGQSKPHLTQVRKYSSFTGYRDLNITAYDSRGNITEQARGNDVNEVYLWGYNYAYPVARVTGSTYAAVAAQVNNTVIQNVQTSDSNMRNELDHIRANLSGSGALVTTYTYNTRFGMTSETDPNGRTIYYEYDVLGRLTCIKGPDGNVLKVFDYEYQKPVTQ